MIDVLSLQREVAEQERKVQTEQAFLRNIWKRAKEAGLPTDVVKAVNKQRKKELPEAQVYLQQYVRISAANGIVIMGPQMTLYDQEDYQPTPEEERIVALSRAEQDGWRAGMGGLDKDANPHPAGSEQSQAWVLWWGRGSGSAKYANGGVSPITATKEQPKARTRGDRAVVVLGENVALHEPPPMPLTDAEQEAVDEAMVEPRRRGRPRKAEGNGRDKVVPIGVKKRGRPPGAKNKPKEMLA